MINSQQAKHFRVLFTPTNQKVIMKTTLNQIRKKAPCKSGWVKLLTHLSKTGADDEPLSIATVLDSNGLDDAIWCLRAVEGYDREIRLYAVWCARQVQHLMTDPRSIAALDVAERFAHGVATQQELAAASASASPAWDAARATANGAATAADAAADAARATANGAAEDAAEDAAWAAAWALAEDAEWAADAAAARAAQEKRLRQLCADCEATKAAT